MTTINAQYLDSGPMTLTAGEALEPYRLVKLDSSANAVYADAGDDPIGYIRERVPKFTTQTYSGQVVAVRTLNGCVIAVLTASGAITKGASVHSANDGKIASSGTSRVIGKALQAATADGDQIAVAIQPATFGPDGSVANVQLFDDFLSYTDAQLWTKAGDDTEVVGMTDAAGGVLSIATDATAEDDDDASIATTNEIFKFAAGKDGFFETRIKFTEANTDDINVFAGLSDTLTTSMLLGSGGGPLASYDGAGFFKVDGGTTWNFECSNAGSQDTEADLVTRASGSWTTLTFVWDDDGTTITITPLINGTAYTPVTMLLAGLEEMHAVLGVRCGGANQETLLVDYVRCVQAR